MVHLVSEDEFNYEIWKASAVALMIAWIMWGINLIRETYLNVNGIMDVKPLTFIIDNIIFWSLGIGWVLQEIVTRWKFVR